MPGVGLARAHDHGLDLTRAIQQDFRVIAAEVLAADVASTRLEDLAGNRIYLHAAITGAIDEGSSPLPSR